MRGLEGVSFAQERLFLESLARPHNPAAVERIALRLQGELQPEALAQGLRFVVGRHPALRTTYEVVDGTVCQRVGDDAALEIEIQPRHPVDRKVREEQVHDVVAAGTCLAFSLTDGPLVRATILSWGQSEHALVLLVHRIACDEPSMSIVLRDLAIEYSALIGGHRFPALMPLECSYFQYVRAQRAKWVADGTAILEFWQRSMADGRRLGLLFDRAPLDLAVPGRSKVRRRITTGLVDRLDNWARARGAAVSDVAVAAYAAVMARYTKHDEVLIGVAISNRGDGANDPLVGRLAGTVPLRIGVTDSATFSHVVDHVQETLRIASTYQDIPAADLASVGGAEPFHTQWAIRESPVWLPEFTGLTASEIELDRGTDAAVAITFDIAGNEPVILADYRTDLFESATISTMLDHYLCFLRSIGNGDTEPFMVDSGETYLLSTVFNPNEEDPVAGRWSLLHRFEERARIAPAAVAIRWRQQELTYGDLDLWACQIAADLRGQGISPGSRVGLPPPCSPATAAALLGIWKAALVCVPLELDDPADRLAHIIADSNISGVIINTAAALPTDERLAGSRDLRLIEVRDPGMQPDHRAGPTPLINSEDPAWIQYVGDQDETPRGLQMSHGAVDQTLSATLDALDITAADVWLCLADSAQSHGIPSVLGALVNGGRLILADSNTSAEPSWLIDVVRSESVSVISGSPESFYPLLPDLFGTAGTGLRYVLLDGEQPSWSRLAKLLAGMDGLRTRLVYVHCAAKDLIPATCIDVGVDELSSIREGNMGRPLAQVRCYVLDEQYRHAGLNVPGELYVGGQIPVQGFVNDPRHTAELFVPDPSTTRLGARIFSTGVIAKWSIDGELIHFGDSAWPGPSESSLDIVGDESERLGGTPIEERIRSLWVELLGRADIGLTDNFFDIGGHSFALITLQHRMAKAGLTVSIADLFRFNTIRACAAHIEGVSEEQSLDQERNSHRRAGLRRFAERRQDPPGGARD